MTWIASKKERSRLGARALWHLAVTQGAQVVAACSKRRLGEGLGYIVSTRPQQDRCCSRCWRMAMFSNTTPIGSASKKNGQLTVRDAAVALACARKSDAKKKLWVKVRLPSGKFKAYPLITIETFASENAIALVAEVRP